MTAPDTRDPTEIEDIRPPDYWGRHVLTKVVIFGALGITIVGPSLVSGDAGTLLLGGGGLVLASLSLVAAAEHMRGRVSPLPIRDMKLLSPIAGIAWAAAFIVGNVGLLCIVLLDVEQGDQPSWLIALLVGAGGLVVVGLMIQIASLSDQWPDKWRPPYARQQPANASDDDPQRERSLHPDTRRDPS